jgi:hypothetical protein
VNIDLTKNDAPTRLSVSTRPKGGATVFLNGKEAIGMKTPLTVSLGPEMVEAGRVRVTAALTGYQRALQEVTIRPGQENKVTLQLGDLPDGPTAVEVITRPRGASVRLNGKMQPRQKTPGSYAVGPEIARTGVVDVTAELDGYEPCTRKVNLVRYKVVRVAMDLTPVKGGGIHAITTPVGAKVYGFSMGRKVAVGATPLMYSPPPEAWRRGTADLIFEPTSPHYSRRRVNRIGLEKDKIKRLEVELEKRPDKTSVAVVTKPKGATVFINGVELEGTRTPLTKRTPIDPDAKHIAETGSVEVTVALEGYERQTRQVALRRSEKSTVEFTLQQFGRQAWLEVITKPSGAQIFLDGANVPGKLTPAIVEVPPPVTAGDSAQVTVALPGYKTAARSVPIEPGGRKRVEFQLEPEAAGVTRLEVKTNPSGARVTINSRPAGGMVTPAVLRLDPQYVDRAITVGASLEGYLPAMRTVSPVKGQTTTVSMDLEREPKADPNAEVGMVDVVFCIDKSGSMKDDIQVMCEHAQDVFDQLSKYASDSGFSLQIGLVTYSRHTDRNWVDVWKLTPDVQEVLGHIRSIRITDVSLGSGGHEDIYGAMMLAMDMPVGGRQIEMGWRSGAVKIMVPIGDEPPAEPDWEGRTLDMVARRAEELDPVHMYPLIVPRRGTFHGGAAVRGMKRLASATGGEPIQVASANDLPHALISTVKFAVRRHREEVWRKQNPPYLLYSMLGGICGLILFALVFFVITQFRKRHGEGVLLVGYRRGILDGDLTGETSARRRSPPTDNSSTELHDPGRQG